MMEKTKTIVITRDQARNAKNAFVHSLNGSMYENGIGGIGISGSKGDWHVRVLLMQREGCADVPNEVDGVPFVAMVVPKIRALRDRERDDA